MKIFFEKSFKCILNKENNYIIFNLSLILLSIEINLISKKFSPKNIYIFRAYNINCIKIIFIFLIKKLALYIYKFL